MLWVILGISAVTILSLILAGAEKYEKLKDKTTRESRELNIMKEIHDKEVD